jgi:hypothetical protein
LEQLRKVETATLDAYIAEHAEAHRLHEIKHAAGHVEALQRLSPEDLQAAFEQARGA